LLPLLYEYYKVYIEDNFYDLAIVDPPYGINCNKPMGFNNYKKVNVHDGKKWDTEIPDGLFFRELQRISKNQIIWGFQYFLEYINTPQKGFLIWDKKQNHPIFADFEAAYYSNCKQSKIFRLHNAGRKEKNRIHPAEKPKELYDWILKNYAKKDFKIFDSHVGSGNIRLSCYDLNLFFEGCEIDGDYWEKQEERYKDYISQPRWIHPSGIYKDEKEEGELFIKETNT